MVYRINEQGLELIKRFEGCKLKSYYCPAGILTIGYGSTGEHVKKNQTITAKEAEDLLREDLTRFEAGVAKLVKSTINENQYSALVSFAFNVGLNALATSTLLKRVNSNPNDPDITNQFKRWNKAGGRVLAGLTRRREAEATLYFK